MEDFSLLGAACSSREGGGGHGQGHGHGFMYAIPSSTSTATVAPGLMQPPLQPPNPNPLFKDEALSHPQTIIHGDPIKARIISHPQYSALLSAYLDCQKACSDLLSFHA